MKDEFAFGVIGGSGLYAFEGLENTRSVTIETPYGEPSSPIVIGELAGKQLAFLARHGIGHIYSPSEVNYRANIYAMKSLGINRIVSVSAVGSLREDYAPGDIVLPDQIYDNTHKRERSFFGKGLVVHVSPAEPFCPCLNSLMQKALARTQAKVHLGGTYITIEGPRFSTKGESNTYRGWGMSLVGMTAAPEVFLAREAEICYATMAHVTDYDCWHVSKEPVTVEMVVKTLTKNTAIAQETLTYMAEMIDESEPELSCSCADGLKDAIITSPDKIDPELRKSYSLLVNKYLK
jgi:5'-methylthioadenosine phosphorylase